MAVPQDLPRPIGDSRQTGLIPRPWAGGEKFMPLVAGLGDEPLLDAHYGS